MEGDLQRTVGENLRRHRKALGLSQEDFADTVRVHRTYLGGLERGERNLTLRSVERIAEWLDVNPLDLLRPPTPEPAARPRRAARRAQVPPVFAGTQKSQPP